MFNPQMKLGSMGFGDYAQMPIGQDPMTQGLGGGAPTGMNPMMAMQGLQMMQGSQGGNPQAQQMMAQRAKQQKLAGLQAMAGGQDGMMQATEMLKRRQGGM